MPLMDRNNENLTLGDFGMLIIYKLPKRHMRLTILRITRALGYVWVPAKTEQRPLILPFPQKTLGYEMRKTT
jgi:hypothetical protein